MSYYAITGIQDGLDVDTTNPLRHVPLRLELDDFCNSTDPIHKNQRALFFQALQNFKAMKPTEKLSYFQIAGIHGQPFVPWDEDGTEVANPKSGYCTHNSILFCTWHRPYMLLFEQVLYGLMRDVANTFSESEKPAMLEAMQSWRFPYWDWAAKKPQPGGAEDDYDLPVVVPFKGVEIKVPASFKASSALPPSFAEGDVWSDPAVPEPGEHRQALRNPLYDFTMPDGYETMGDSKLGKLAIKPGDFKEDGVDYLYPLNLCKGTTRHAEMGPDSNLEEYWIDGRQNNNGVRQYLRKTHQVKDVQVPGNLRASLSDVFYRVVTIEKFEDFATKRVQGLGPDAPKNKKQEVYASAENLHDWIHFVCGGPAALRKLSTRPETLQLLGHMGNVPVAAFDPIFWIHHCNVDRLVAIWEILHSGDGGNWFDGSDGRDKDSGNWAIDRGHADLPSDPLRPFHKDGGKYWTSNDTRETAPHGYTYPELEKWKHVDSHGNYDAAAHKKALTAYVNTRYNAAARAAVKAQLTADPGDSKMSSNLPNLLQLQMATPDPKPAEDIIGFNDYAVNVVYNRFALAGRPYTIHIFVGKVPDRLPYTFDDPEGSLVGQVYTFSSPADTFGTDAEVGCVNCRTQEAADIESSGTVPLTNALITRWKNELQHTPRQRLADGEDVPRVLASMEPQDVVPFLEANFRWRVTSLDGLVSPEDLPSLRVSVAVGKADHYADPKKLSRFYDYKGANEVTKDRPQGAGPDDALYPPGQEYTVDG